MRATRSATAALLLAVVLNATRSLCVHGESNDSATQWQDIYDRQTANETQANANATVAANATEPSSTTDPDTASETVESIFDSARGVQLGGSLLAALAILLGAIMAVAGYRLFLFACFIKSFVMGGVALAMYVESEFADRSWVVLASWVAFVVGGLLCGLLTLLPHKARHFISGASAGVVLAMLVHNSWAYGVYPAHPNVVLFMLCVVLGLVCGVLAVKLYRPVVIVSTSLFGAAICVWGVGYFAGDFPSPANLLAYASQDVHGRWVYDIPVAWWAYLASIVLVFVLGALVQFFKTARERKEDVVVVTDSKKKSKDARPTTRRSDTFLSPASTTHYVVDVSDEPTPMRRTQDPAKNSTKTETKLQRETLERRSMGSHIPVMDAAGERVAVLEVASDSVRSSEDEVGPMTKLRQLFRASLRRSEGDSDGISDRTEKRIKRWRWHRRDSEDDSEDDSDGDSDGERGGWPWRRRRRRERERDSISF